MSCQVHGYHWPPVLGTVTHHIWPLGMGGPDVASNRVQTCDTGHRNMHRILDAFFQGTPDRNMGTRKEYALARQGFEAWVAAGKPDHPVYEVSEP